MAHPNFTPPDPTLPDRNPTSSVLRRMAAKAVEIEQAPEMFAAEQLDRIRGGAFALALAAGLPDEHRLLAELLAERAVNAHERVAALAGELSARIAMWGVAASEALWRADRAEVYGSERGQR